MTDPKLVPELIARNILDAAVAKATEQIADLIYVDPHQWSNRPCQTCRAITAAMGKPFGCYRYQREREGK